MGLLISFLKKKESTESLLENLSKEISGLKETRVRNSDLERRLASRLILYSSIIYVISAICWYYWGTGIAGNEWYSQFLFTMPFILSPLLLLLLRRFLRWFFVRRISQAEEDLKLLENEREEIFKQLMEKETYKRVVELMKKYFPEKLREGSPKILQKNDMTNASSDSADTPLGNSKTTGQNVTEGKTRKEDSPTHGGNLRHRRTPALGVSQNGSMKSPNVESSPAPQLLNQKPPALIRPILPQNRSTTDRLIDWVLGDGLDNRYALICQSCRSHNGMALREEFEYLAFRCAYCGFFNAARKSRGINNQLTNCVPPNSEESSHSGSQTNLASTDSNSQPNLSSAENYEADLLQSTRE